MDYYKVHIDACANGRSAHVQSFFSDLPIDFEYITDIRCDYKQCTDTRYKTFGHYYAHIMNIHKEIKPTAQIDDQEIRIVDTESTTTVDNVSSKDLETDLRKAETNSRLISCPCCNLTFSTNSPDQELKVFFKHLSVVLKKDESKRVLNSAIERLKRGAFPASFSKGTFCPFPGCAWLSSDTDHFLTNHLDQTVISYLASCLSASDILTIQANLSPELLKLLNDILHQLKQPAEQPDVIDIADFDDDDQAWVYV